LGENGCESMGMFYFIFGLWFEYVGSYVVVLCMFNTTMCTIFFL